MLGRGELRCIGATTLDEYRKHIEKDPALERCCVVSSVHLCCWSWLPAIGQQSCPQ